MSADVIKQLIDQRVAKALANQDANRNSGIHQNGQLNQPLNFKGTEGVVGLTQWIEKMEYVFHISNYTMECQGTDVVSYTQRFQELALLCSRMLPEESDQVEKYVGGLPNMIQINVMSTRPKTMQEAIELANDLMDQKVHTFAKRQAENKRKLDNNTRDNHVQQSPFKRRNMARAYTARPGEKKVYAGTLTFYNKCNFHQNGPCAAKCTNCKRVGHLSRDCRSPTAANNQRAPGNKNRGNQSGNGEARGKAYSLGVNNANTYSNVVTGTFLLNNSYASVLFDTGADRSFLSTTFSSLIEGFIRPSSSPWGSSNFVCKEEGRIVSDVSTIEN
ncbi:putative reverse transcriptase domain-containing protein [Tanacetum coccineum]